MAKKRLTELSEEYGISFDESQKIVFDNLEEEMVSGKGRNLWINEDGQRMLEDLISMPVLYRGKVLRAANNPRFVIAYIKDIVQKVKVSIPYQLQDRLINKVIYIESDNSGAEVKYKYVKPPIR